MRCRCQVLKSLVFDVGIAQFERSDGFSQKSSLFACRLHEGQTQSGTQNLQRNGRGASARSEIEPNPGRICDPIGREQRLNQQPIERGVAQRLQAKCREIDLRVPSLEQLEIQRQLLQYAWLERHAELGRAAFEPTVEFSGFHGAVSRPTWAART